MKKILSLMGSLVLLAGLMLPIPAGAHLPEALIPEPAASSTASLQPRDRATDLNPPDAAITATPYFTDVAPQMNATAPGYGTGVAWGDYDGDGDLDLYVVNLGPGGAGQANVLLRNDGNTFTDVSAEAGVDDAGPGVAAAWADMDNDGDLDLFVSNRPGNNALFLNEGNGHFQNVAIAAGVADPTGYGEGSAWVDFDRDGLADLYVANYSSAPGYQPNRLFHNLDGLHFADVAAELGVADMGNGEGIAWADFDNDGDMDLFIANASAGANDVLFQQQDDGTFVNVAAQMHVLGGPYSGYGAAWGDYDNDGWLDLYVAQQGPNKLYHNLNGTDFADVTNQAGVGGDRYSLGCAWGDFDNDGWLDLYVANADLAPYNPGDILYHNEGGSPVTFSDVTAPAGVTNTLNARGCAWGDFDNDGALDLYVVNQGTNQPQPNRLFHNNGNSNHWLEVILTGCTSNRSAVGARVTVTSDRAQIREISGGSGFASQDSLPAEFGLASWDGPVTMTVRWPSSIQTSLTVEPADRIITLTEPCIDLAGATKAVSADAARPGDVLTYTIAVPNSGDWPASAGVTDTLPLQLTWGDYLTATSGTPTWDAGGQRVLWSGAISAGLAVTITYRVTINPGLAPGTLITNTATVDDGYRPPFDTPPVTTTVLCQELAEVDFDYAPATPLTGQSVTFTATATGSLPITFTWGFGDGGTASGAVVTHTYTVAGDYTVIMTATNGCGQQVVSHILTVVSACVPPADADFTWYPPTPLVGEDVTFNGTASGTPPISYTWAFGDGGSASGATVVHAFAAPGLYPVTLTATNGCGQQVVLHTLTVVTTYVAPAGADFTWVPITPTAGATVDFFGSLVTGTAPLTWTWEFGDGGSGSGQNTGHVFAGPDTYAVTMTVANECGQDDAVHTVVVVPRCEPVTDTAFTWYPPTPLVGEDVTFNGTASGTLPITFTWDFGDDGTASGAGVTHTYTVAGDYLATLTATNACDQEVVTHTIPVTGCELLQGTDFTWTPPTPMVGGVVTFTGSASGTLPITFTWDFGDGLTATGTPVTHTYGSTGTYTVVMTATNKCDQEAVSAALTVTVCYKVEKVVIAGPTRLQVSEAGLYTATYAPITATPPLTFTWDNGALGPTAVYSWTLPGTYTLTVTVTNRCGWMSGNLSVEVSAVSYQIYLPLILRGW